MTWYRRVSDVQGSAKDNRRVTSLNPWPRRPLSIMSEDDDLAAIRSKRMQDLQSMQSQHQKQEEMQQQQKQAINALLNQVLDQQARARLNTIMVAKPEKGRQVESVIVQMATSGQIMGKLSENDLIGLVERVNAQTQKTTSVKFDRRRAAIDDDDDW